MSSYHDGRRVEYKVRDALAGAGWVVVRPAASHGAADLIAFHPRRVVAFVQVKRSGQIRPPERRRLIAMADLLGPCGLPVVASKPPRKPLTYRLLTGTAPNEWVPWEPEHAPVPPIEVLRR